MNLGKKINNIAISKRVLFTTPSHDRNSFVIPDFENFFGSKFLLHDLSEINDLDNLADPQNDILKSMSLSASLLNVNDLFYLINGSSSGIIAAITAVLSPGDKVLIARNCHKSVLNGLILTGAHPIWFLPDFNKNWSIFDSVNPLQIDSYLRIFPDIKAVIITSPTYEGVCSDISSIADVCRKFSVKLIVDEAHGALKSFAPHFFGKNAILCGADISVQSLHKTCGAPNPSAILLSNGSINRQVIQDALNLFITSSPSYPILAAIESTINFLSSDKGLDCIHKLIKYIIDFKSAFRRYNNIHFCPFNDPSKLLVKIDGLSGFALSDILFDEFNIEDESANASSFLFLTGIGTKKNKLNLLENALKSILNSSFPHSDLLSSCPLIIPDSAFSPRQAFFSDKIVIDISKSFGRVCAQVITEYPPGIPLLIPGEVISHSHINYLKNKFPLIKVIR